jgi:hypothetical protein
LPPQPKFLSCHLAIIPLMIEARQVKNPMQHKNLYFRSYRVPQAAGILSRHVGGNCKIAGRLFHPRPLQQRRRKGQYVRRLVFSPESQVQGTEFAAIGHQDIHGATQTHGLPRPQQKTLEG